MQALQQVQLGLRSPRLCCTAPTLKFIVNLPAEHCGMNEDTAATEMMSSCDLKSVTSSAGLGPMGVPALMPRQPLLRHLSQASAGKCACSVLRSMRSRDPEHELSSWHALACRPRTWSSSGYPGQDEGGGQQHSAD